MCVSMLLSFYQVNGVGPECALAVVAKYPTPASYMAALDRCSTNNEKIAIVRVSVRSRLAF